MVSKRLIEQFMSQIDEEDIQAGIQTFVESQVVPALRQVRQRHDAGPSNEEVREQFQMLTDDEKQEYFYDAISEVVSTIIRIRIQPNEGFRRAKSLLRNPWVTESLLLIFEHESVDEAGSEEMKEFTLEHMHIIGVALLPEMYHPEERKGVFEQFGIEQSVIDEYERSLNENGVSNVSQADELPEATDD